MSINTPWDDSFGFKAVTLSSSRPKLANMGTSLKQRGDGEKRRQKTDSDRPCQISTPRFKSDTCCCSLASKAPGNQEVCYHVVKVPLSFPNKLRLLLLLNPHPLPVHHPAQVLLIKPLLLSTLHSLHLRPPSSSMPVTNALPVCVYETNCCHPSPFKNHSLDFHILLLLRSLRYILPTFIY